MYEKARTQINLRLSRTLRDRIDEIARANGSWRNQQILDWITEAIQSYDAEGKRVIDMGYLSLPKETQDEIEAKAHRHRYIKVDGTEVPGRLLGETEATYECVCGKSERRKVTHG